MLCIKASTMARTSPTNTFVVSAKNLFILAAALFTLVSYVSGSYDVIVDPVSGRPGHVARKSGSAFGMRRQLKAGCGSFIACPSAIDAAKIILGNNPNLTISNATFSKGTCTSTMSQWGIVPAGGWAPGHQMTAWFPNGSLVLSSGDASAGNCAVNTLDYFTLMVGGGGDANLNALIPAYTTYDAVALEFVVTALKDGLLVFKYAFGSDEYTEWVGTAFNDVFGFFIAPVDQPITTGHNVAIVKGTTNTQVSINNVNFNSHADIWTNNRIGAVSPLKALEADGYTNLLNTQGFQVTANQQYRFKLAVADAGDHILDSWVWLGGDTLIIDSKPVANGTVDTPTSTCANKIITLNGSSSYDPDTDDVLTFKWVISAACYPTVTKTGAVVTVDLSTLADNVTYTVSLFVTDSSDVEDALITKLSVPPGCGSKAITKNCGASPNPPPPPPPPNNKPSPPPSVIKSPPPPPPPPAPPPPPPPYIGDYIMAGNAGIVPCGSPGVTIDVSVADNDIIAQINTAMDGTPYQLYYIWGVFDMYENDIPIFNKTTNSPITSFTAAELLQGRSLKKYKILVDVTNTDQWDQGDGGILSAETFIQVLQCPIQPSWPLPTIIFNTPESFTLACGTSVLLDASAAVAWAVAKKGSSGTTQKLRWTLQDDLDVVVWTLDSPAPSTQLDGASLLKTGALSAGTFYTLRLVVFIDTKDFDNDDWETKMSVLACTPGTYPSPPPPPPGSFKPPPSPPSPPPPKPPSPPPPPPSPPPKSPSPPPPKPPLTASKPPPPKPPPPPPPKPPSPPPSMTTKPPPPKPPPPPSSTTTKPPPPPPPSTTAKPSPPAASKPPPPPPTAVKSPSPVKVKPPPKLESPPKPDSPELVDRRRR
ncbi:hypothetical protein Vretimale_224 [Volvox reticuliferus]|uniref:PKD/REJ-like domain-containing protein n=1 Tax=Volvox reticuliferus TaxID=1737510 RepID=A0A8J4FX06_9CHLO|nr:hypothetical protein Vretifemale_8319 [Volvox reticuliferus]GIL93861.1 hypothetical protein Vretimale_224 [Volvox reticuliferus]